MNTKHHKTLQVDSHRGTRLALPYKIWCMHHRIHTIDSILEGKVKQRMISLNG
jgi:hypothetical protein